MLELAQTYLDDSRISYRRVVRPGHIQITYATADNPEPADSQIPEPSGDTEPSGDAEEEPPDPILDHSTVWRWLTWLGCQAVALTVGMGHWFQHDPSDSWHRFVGAVDPDKYRSPERGERLRTARRLLHLRNRWDRTFDKKFFTRFATRGSDP